ncbi:elastin-like [Corvus hawaiiensis]|uniref:elastin-like n=1 Tax=Corvus hawaiiensis TaxID=134902 RepID=UPI002019D276|nr:elastin-like [Corvus hawaiiensis]
MRSARRAAFSRRDGGALTGAAVPAVPGAGSGLWRGAGRCPGGWSGLPLGAGEPPLAKGPGWGSCAGSRFAPPGSAVRAERPRDVCGDGRGVPELGPGCFPDVLAEIRPWGSCREGCPAQLPRKGLPRLSSPGGRGTCSRLVLPVKFGTVSMQDTAQGTGRGAQPGTRPQQERPWAPWRGRMSPGEERGPSAAPAEAGTGGGNVRDTGDAAAAVPRRAGGPASRPLPGMGLGEASTRRLARLRSPMEEAGLPAARSSSSGRPRPPRTPGCRSRGSGHETFLPQLQVIAGPAC